MRDADIVKSVEEAPCEAKSAAPLLDRITSDVYARLRRLARAVMRGERAGHTLQPTAVLNEAILRLSRAGIRIRDLRHLYRVTAQAMRRVLVDHARERRRLKRTAPEAAELDAASHESPELFDLLDIDAALEQLARESPRTAALVELSYFAGLEDVEISQLCGISLRTVQRERRFARAYLAAHARRRLSSR